MNQLLILLAVVVVLIMLNNKPQALVAEGFNGLKQNDPGCLDCYYKSPQECMNCTNCGLCGNGRFQKCVPGDVAGPYFSEGCEDWTYNDKKRQYSKGCDKYREMVTTRPWSWFNPSHKMIRWPAPMHVQRLGE